MYFVFATEPNATGCFEIVNWRTSRRNTNSSAQPYGVEGGVPTRRTGCSIRYPGWDGGGVVVTLWGPSLDEQVLSRGWHCEGCCLTILPAFESKVFSAMTIPADIPCSFLQAVASVITTLPAWRSIYISRRLCQEGAGDNTIQLNILLARCAGTNRQLYVAGKPYLFLRSSVLPFRHRSFSIADHSPIWFVVHLVAEFKRSTFQAPVPVYGHKYRSTRSTSTLSITRHRRRLRGLLWGRVSKQ